jgi:pentatricopeptide repeat protein
MRAHGIEPDAHSYTMVVNAYAQAGNYNGARAVIGEMLEHQASTGKEIPEIAIGALMNAAKNAVAQSVAAGETEETQRIVSDALALFEERSLEERNAHMYALPPWPATPICPCTRI